MMELSSYPIKLCCGAFFALGNFAFSIVDYYVLLGKWQKVGSYN